MMKASSVILLLTIVIVAATVPARALSLQNDDGIFVGSVALNSAGTGTSTDIDTFISEVPQASPINIPGVGEATDQMISADSAELSGTDQSLSEILYFLSDFASPMSEQLISNGLLSGQIGPTDETLVPEPACLSMIGLVLLAVSRKRK